MGLASLEFIAICGSSHRRETHLLFTLIVSSSTRLTGVNAGLFALPTLTRVLYPFFFFFGFPFLPFYATEIEFSPKAESEKKGLRCRNTAVI